MKIRFDLTLTKRLKSKRYARLSFPPCFIVQVKSLLSNSLYWKRVATFVFKRGYNLLSMRNKMAKTALKLSLCDWKYVMRVVVGVSMDYIGFVLNSFLWIWKESTLCRRYLVVMLAL